MKPFFSIVIPTLNEEKNIGHLLSDLANQTNNRFEVIHVDANSQDETLSEVKKFNQQLRLTTLTTKKRNVSFQRNLGADSAKGNWVIFMDADNRLPKHFLQGLRYQIDKFDNLDLFTCWLDVNQYSAKYKPFARFLNFSFSLVNKEAFGALIAIRKEITQKIRFDEALTYQEDGQYVQDAIKADYNFKVLKEPRYYYSMRRFEKEGLAKVVATYLESRLFMLTNGDISSFSKYPMEGGGFYEEDSDPSNKKISTYILELDSFLRNATKKQLSKAKKIWQLLIASEESDD